MLGSHTRRGPVRPAEHNGNIDLWEGGGRRGLERGGWREQTGRERREGEVVYYNIIIERAEV